MTSLRAEFGVIGGSGFYAMPGLRDACQVDVSTPFGEPSSSVTIGELEGAPVAFIARHGSGHQILPDELPSRANIYALKSLGVSRIFAVSAVGSLRDEIAPLHAVIPDQLIDRTTGRVASFFGEGAVGHIGFADPFCPQSSEALAAAAEGAGVTVHRGGTLVVINGPAFSTRAESNLYRASGGSVIGMTTVPEARLAREAELCYSSLCFVTDYDVWHESEADVSADLVVTNLRASAERALDAVRRAARALAGVERTCACGDALATALITARDRVPPSTRDRLGLIVERYWGRRE